MRRLYLLPLCSALFLVGCGGPVDENGDPHADVDLVVEEESGYDDGAALDEELDEELAAGEVSEDEVIGDDDLDEELDVAEEDVILEEELTADELTHFGTLAASTPPTVRTKRFRVLNWNIAGGKENGCAPAKIRRAVMRYVRESNEPVDFISLNEVCPEQYRAIRDALRTYWNKSGTARFSAFERGGGSRVGNAIFSRRNLRKVTKHKVGEDQYGDRYLVCGRQERRRVRVCSVHLTPGDVKARKQLTRVLSHIEGFWSDKRDSVIIAGDFNLTADDHGMNRIYAPGASTPNNQNNSGNYRELDDKDPVCRGYGERTLPWTTGGPCGKGRKIDFVFARANRIVDRQYGANSLDIPADCTGVCSDHRAIRGWVDLKFRVDDVATTDGGATTPEPEPEAETASSTTLEMTYVTANIGRDYNTKAQVQAVFDRIGDTIGPWAGPKYIGWQEIGGSDPCGGTCEIEALRNRFKSTWGWTTRHPRGEKPNGTLERVNTPVTSKGADSGNVRATFASPAWPGVSRTRFVTVVYHPDRNVSVINTHFIAGAWTCKSNVAKRRDYWRRAWRTLKDEVAREHDRGRNVIVTGDLNRPRRTTRCNPDWDPSSLHARAKVVGGAGIDYIFAVPAAGQKFVVSRRPNGTKDRGSIHIGIDGHKAHWVSGRFRQQ